MLKKPLFNENKEPHIKKAIGRTIQVKKIGNAEISRFVYQIFEININAASD